MRVGDTSYSIRDHDARASMGKHGQAWAFYQCRTRRGELHANRTLFLVQRRRRILAQPCDLAVDKTVEASMVGTLLFFRCQQRVGDSIPVACVIASCVSINDDSILEEPSTVEGSS